MQEVPIPFLPLSSPVHNPLLTHSSYPLPFYTPLLTQTSSSSSSSLSSLTSLFPSFLFYTIFLSPFLLLFIHLSFPFLSKRSSLSHPNPFLILFSFLSHSTFPPLPFPHTLPLNPFLLPPSFRHTLPFSPKLFLPLLFLSHLSSPSLATHSSHLTSNLRLPLSPLPFFLLSP